MIQRIQSIYLLITAILMAVTAFSPLVSLTDESKAALDFCSLGVYKLSQLQNPSWGVVTFALLSALLSFVNIFLYKKRKTQMRMGTITSLSILFFYVTTLVYFNSFLDQYHYLYAGIQYGIILPLIALVFNVLAILKIKKDDKLVRSLDRIR